MEQDAVDEATEADADEQRRRRERTDADFFDHGALRSERW
jgi:hypothetical protein